MAEGWVYSVFPSMDFLSIATKFFQFELSGLWPMPLTLDLVLPHTKGRQMFPQ